MKHLLFIYIALQGITTYSQVKLSNNCNADITLIQKTIAQTQNKANEELKSTFPIYTRNGIDYLSFLAKTNEHYDSSLLIDKGCIIGSKIEDIISLKIPLLALSEIQAFVGISTLQVAKKIKPDLSRVLYDIRADSVHLGIDLPQSYTGKDVIIGITDWGFDYSHPMFYDTLLEHTRILAAWDQFKTSGPHPAGFDYGTEYDSPSELIAAGSDTANIYSYATHGSHVAGIAGGSGAGTAFRGVAFECDYLFTTFLVDESAVLDAWQWMYNKAESAGKRLVINMSWGLYHTGPLDGTSLLSQSIDYFSDAGILFVTSGGNNGDVDFHLEKTFSNDTLLSRIEFYTGALATLWGQSIHAWGQADKSFEAGFNVLNLSGDILAESPWYNTIDTESYIDSFLVVPGLVDTVWYNLSMDDLYPTNNRPQMRLRIKKVPASYRIALKATSLEGTVHFWNVTELITDVGNWGMPFSSLGDAYSVGDNNFGIGAPACTQSALTVAAHNSEYLSGGGAVIGGQLAGFSSRGPLINNQLKPDISGPGINVASSISSYTDNSFAPITTVTFEGRDYPFARFSGTSMSSPTVAGVAALILEANPYLSSWQVKQILIETAREDDDTGIIPVAGSSEWGWGKVNAFRAIIKAINTVGYAENKPTIDWSIYPNPTSTNLTIEGIDLNEATIQIIDLNGKLHFNQQSTNKIDVSNLSSGTYLLRIIKANKVSQLKFIVQ